MESHWNDHSDEGDGVLTGHGLKRFLRSVGATVGLKPAESPAGGSERSPDWYDARYQRQDAYQLPYYRSHYYFMWTVIADRLRRDRIRRVLEIGCGPAQLACLLLEQGVEHYSGLDFSSTAVSLAQKNAPTGQFIVGDARSTELYEKSDYEIIICTEVLEHIQEDLSVVSLFPPGTRCVFSVPNFRDPSHVRVFSSLAEVEARYGPFFLGLDVITLKSPYWTLSEPDSFFLADGVRNDRRMDQDSGAVAGANGMTTVGNSKS
jgi:SAM-dependent methyltransferase